MNCFVVSQLISVARHTRLFKPVSKSGGFYASQISYRTPTNKLSVSEGIMTYMYHFSFVSIYTLNGYRVLNSLEKL